MEKAYFDYAATTPTHPEVVTAMLPYFEEKFGNPSSIHGFGRETKAAIQDARLKVADLLGADQAEIVFTGSGTESDNFALEGVAFSREKEGRHIISTPIEHHAILETLKFLEKRGFKVTYLPVDQYGMVNPEDIKKYVNDETILVSVMHANNEIGTIEPLAEISKVIRELNINRENRIYLHTDAVQTVGQIPVNVNELGVDLLSLSAHKFYGPKGVGALYIRKGTKLVSFMHGGEQERGRRASTENVPGIVGLGKACEIAKKELPVWTTELTRLRDKLKNGLFAKISDIELNGHPTLRLPKNLDVSIQYVEGESMLLSLDMEGIAVSTGSACSSGSLEPSHVMLAIGKTHEQAHGSIRFSLGRLTTEKEIDYVLEVFPPIVERLRKMSPLYKGVK
ncbi:MAG: cysteine desulfurase NifS [Candidatus Saganbacteria bacterium]|nr:cysteine desulfurase NifS [Candidatus Saganbacteria bacterium]